jgi:chemotaxis response regulator CheB
VKIAIVNDLPMVVETLRRIVTEEDRHEVIWVAENGKTAIESCAHQVPDLILMDLVMPVMNGIESTRRIMKLSPCPILVVTATVASNSGMVFEALGAGALDVVVTPAVGAGKNTSGEELLSKIDRIGKISGIKDTSAPQRPVQKKEAKVPQGKGPCLVVIGCSTGGPHALVSVLHDIPADLPVSIVVVQHMDAKFSGGLADWLNSQVQLSVRVMKEGDQPQPGVVLIPSTDNHVIMLPGTGLGYSIKPIDIFYHPSVDVFFNSVARYWRGRCVGVILTGMGRDGAEGLLALRRQGHFTIAQDRQSSVVYGMPKAAVELEAVQTILPINNIGSAINNILAQERG